ncbi:uncharacterized protein LOC120211321 [Hibiscus syriacus]|uniref:uncharacterized protein LOC120211321 n=1 Tax=Hibiscus syriacus TaxID=106335 RepID=UPI00192358A3|nr:uncharacterized protein LOC120211321 [Hibiscus syriacus]
MSKRLGFSRQVLPALELGTCESGVPSQSSAGYIDEFRHDSDDGRLLCDTIHVLAGEFQYYYHLSCLNPTGKLFPSFLLDSVAGLKHDTGLAAEWSADEQYILEDGLEKYKEEPNILKYIKIAATLRDKTVRDVALRCRWMQRKRRKPEEHNLGKKVNHRKDKLVESSSKMNMPSSLPQTMAAYPLMMHHLD